MKKKPSKLSPLKPRLAAHQLKPEQVHQSKKNYNRHQVKKVIQELIKASPNKTD